MNSFTIIHQKRTVLIRHVSLSSTMDLVALLDADGKMSVHRTMSWVRYHVILPFLCAHLLYFCYYWLLSYMLFSITFPKYRLFDCLSLLIIIIFQIKIYKYNNYALIHSKDLTNDPFVTSYLIFP